MNKRLKKKKYKGSWKEIGIRFSGKVKSYEAGDSFIDRLVEFVESKDWNTFCYINKENEIYSIVEKNKRYGKMDKIDAIILNNFLNILEELESFKLECYFDVWEVDEKKAELGIIILN